MERREALQVQGRREVGRKTQSETASLGVGKGDQERMSSFIVNKVTKVLGVDQDQDDDDVNTPLKRGKVSVATAPTQDPHLLSCLPASDMQHLFFRGIASEFPFGWTAGTCGLQRTRWDPEQVKEHGPWPHVYALHALLCRPLSLHIGELVDAGVGRDCRHCGRERGIHRPAQHTQTGGSLQPSL